MFLIFKSDSKLCLYSQLDYLNSSNLNEEYTQRLATMEKKFQQAIREKDQLQKQLDV